MNNIKKIDTNKLRVDLTRYLTKNSGDTIYITKYNRLVAELKTYTDKMRREAELKIAKRMVESANKNNYK
jgi:hypothetical protein